MRDTFQGSPEVSISITCTNLAKSLKEAADAHHIYEKGLGHPDPDWPLWYATFIDLERRSTLVKDEEKGGYRAKTQAELIEEVRAYTIGRDAGRELVKEAEAMEAGVGVVEEGKERLKAAHPDEVSINPNALYDSLNNAFQAGARAMEERMALAADQHDRLGPDAS